MTIIFLVLLIWGSFMYSYVEGWNYLDSLYFGVMTVTMIGYGDIVPKTNIGKIFTMFFSFVGIAIVFYLFSAIGKYVLRDAFESKMKEHSDRLLTHIKKSGINYPRKSRRKTRKGNHFVHRRIHQMKKLLGFSSAQSEEVKLGFIHLLGSFGRHHV